MAVWDEIRRGAQSVVDDGQKLARLAVLKTQIKALETALGDKIYDLGTRTLDLHRRNELHHYELDQIFVEIQGMQRELKEKQVEADTLFGPARPGAAGHTTTCPDCGRPIREEDRFCRHCGADLKGA